MAQWRELLLQGAMAAAWVPGQGEKERKNERGGGVREGGGKAGRRPILGLPGATPEARRRGLARSRTLAVACSGEEGSRSSGSYLLDKGRLGRGVSCSAAAGTGTRQARGAEDIHSSGSNREEEALDGLAGRMDPDVEDETRGGGGRERMDGTSP